MLTVKKTFNYFQKEKWVFLLILFAVFYANLVYKKSWILKDIKSGLLKNIGGLKNDRLGEDIDIPLNVIEAVRLIREVAENDQQSTVIYYVITGDLKKDDLFFQRTVEISMPNLHVPAKARYCVQIKSSEECHKLGFNDRISGGELIAVFK